MYERRHGACTRSIASRARRLALVGALLAAWPAVGQPLGMVRPDRWRPHADVGLLDRVTLNMHWFDDFAALREAALTLNVDAVDLRGFSVLRRSAGGNEWVCDVYVVRMRGALVDKERTTTFGHEVLHCFGLGHE